MTAVNEWMNNPALKNMDTAKLELIRMAAERTRGKSGKDLAPGHACPDYGSQQAGYPIYSG